MPRPAALLACLLPLLGAAPVTAQPTPADPIDLVRGLRENGLSDLALDYLQELAAKRPSPGVLAVIPLERARARLELASAETDDAKRSALLSEAKADFDKFLAANSSHPRRAEAALSLARLVSIEAKGVVSQANKRADDAARARELVAARPVFTDAAKRFSQAAAEFAKKLDDAAQSPAARRAAVNDLYQARLDEAVNTLELARTYSTAGAAAADLVARGKAVDEARKLFVALAGEDADQPLCWVARAWVGECDLEKADPVKAKEAFDAVKKEARRAPSVAGAGARTAEFFELRADFLKAVGGANPAELRKSQTAIERWLAEPGRAPRASPEVAAARFYLATAKIKQAEQQTKKDAKTGELTVTGAARALYQSAERDLRQLQEPENEYTVRAAEARARVIRTLIGDPDKIDPAKLTDFEAALMLAQVQYTRAAKGGESAEARKAAAGKAVAAFERLRKLGTPPEFALDARAAAANLAYAYLLADKPYQAAVLGESVARTDRDPSTASRAGLIALNAYRSAAAKLETTDTRARRRDLDRADAVGLLLDAKFPREAYTDSARLQVVRDYLQQRKYLDAFRLAARVAEGSPAAIDARYLQSLAAVELLRGPVAGAASTLSPVEKADIFQTALKDLRGLPPVPPTAPRGEARLAVFLPLQRAELHILNGAADLAKAEACAKEATQALGTLKELTPDDKLELGMRVELTRMRALWGQALTAFQAGKYPEAVAKLAPVLADAQAKGQVTKEGMPDDVAEVAKRVDEYRREKVVGLAMQARVREGAIEKVGELFDLLKKLGGSLTDSAATLSVMIDGVRPQIEKLRRDGKGEEADKLAAGIGSVLDKVAAEKDVKPPTIIVLAEGLNSIGSHAKAVDLLKRIPPPADMAVMKTRPSELKDPKEQLAALRYRNAQLEMLRAYRDGGQFAEGDAIVAAAVGDGKPGSGWAVNSDFRREAALLLEAKAAAEADPQAAMKLWAEARGKWTEMSNQYFSPLKRLAGGKNDPKLAMRALLDLNQLPKSDKLPEKEADIKAGLTDRNPPAWLTELTEPTTKGADGTTVEHPAAAAYVQEMQNTTTRLESVLKPLFHALVFESLRCGIRANVSLLKGKPEAVAGKLEPYAKQLIQLETANPDLTDDIKAKFAGMLDEYPVLKEQYQKLGGKAFLRPATN
jgi:hypothetical protein